MTSTVVSFAEFCTYRQLRLHEQQLRQREEIEELIESLNTAVRNEDLSLSEACLLLIKAKQRLSFE